MSMLTRLVGTLYGLERLVRPLNLATGPAIAVRLNTNPDDRDNPKYKAVMLFHGDRQATLAQQKADMNAFYQELVKHQRHFVEITSYSDPEDGIRKWTDKNGAEHLEIRYVSNLRNIRWFNHEAKAFVATIQEANAGRTDREGQTQSSAPQAPVEDVVIEVPAAPEPATQDTLPF